MSSVFERADGMSAEWVLRDALNREALRALRRRSRLRLFAGAVVLLGYWAPMAAGVLAVQAIVAGSTDSERSLDFGIASIVGVGIAAFCWICREPAAEAVELADAEVQSVGAAFVRFMDREGSLPITPEGEVL